MGRFSPLPNLFVAFWYINNVSDSKHITSDTDVIIPKSLKFKVMLRRFRETCSRTVKSSIILWRDDTRSRSNIYF